jgi:pimeloyl-ACP methyl ester carboxylesterase
MTSSMWNAAAALVAGLALIIQPVIAQAAVEQTTAKVTDTTIELPSGKKVFYRDSGGTGIPVVFLHAGSGNSMLWEKQIPVFANNRYRFIAIDYNGVTSGSSGAQGGPGGPGSAALIDELVTKLALPKFHLVGTAAGGGAALQYALAHRDKLRSITIANSIGNVQDKSYSDMGNRMRPAAFNQLPVEIRELGPSYRAVNPEGVERWLALSGKNELTAPAGGMGAAANDRMGASQPPPAPPGGAGANNPNAVTWTNLETFKVPTLLLTGDADLYTPPSVLRMFVEHMKHAEYKVIPESGHSAYWENPETFNRTVLTFIRKH